MPALGGLERHSWATPGKFVFDGLVYGVVTGVAFGWPCPGAVPWSTLGGQRADRSAQTSTSSLRAKTCRLAKAGCDQHTPSRCGS